MTNKHDINQLVLATKRLLATICGKTLETCTSREFFKCFSYSIKDTLLPIWKATDETYDLQKVKKLYYFSMEYLMGRSLGNIIINLKSSELVKEALKIMNRDLQTIEDSEREAGLGSGGLGRLAACFLDSLATMHLPALGYGLRYRFGIFAQEIQNGYQIERADRWLTSTNPWETKRADESVLVNFGGSLETKTDDNGNLITYLKNSETVRAIPFDTPVVGYKSENNVPTINTLRLWSAGEEPMNFGIVEYNQGEFQKAFKNNTITYVLYPDDRHPEGRLLRLKQQFFLVSASIQDIIRKFKRNYSDFSLFPEKCALQINDTHPTLVIPELIRILTQVEGLDWNNAFEITRKTCSYTNHTLMAEALEKWNIEIFKKLLPRQFEIIKRIDKLLKDEVSAKFPNDNDKIQRMSIIKNGHVEMAHLAVTGSSFVNGVAELHSTLLKSRTLKDFHDLYPHKFLNVTNGVTQRRWLLKANPRLAELITSKIGNSWITNLKDIKKIEKFSSDKNFIDSFLEIKQENKNRLATYIKERNPYKDEEGKTLFTFEIDPNSLFDIQIKRLHEYKRQLLNLLHIMLLYNELKENPSMNIVPRTFIFGAKASAAYTMAKNIIKLINSVSKKIHFDDDVNKKISIVFIEDYNVTKAELLFSAADLSEQISTASMEASGTGNMKFSLNGSLTIGTDDGANVEMKAHVGNDSWPFTFGLSADEVLSYHSQGNYKPREIYEKSPKLKKILDQLIDGTYCENENESGIFKQIYSNLLDGINGSTPDYFMVLKDFDSYVKTQEKAGHLFKNKTEWARLAILNMAAMGSFSTDVSIDNYNKKIWNLKPTPPSEEINREMIEKYNFKLDIVK